MLPSFRSGAVAASRLRTVRAHVSIAKNHTMAGPIAVVAGAGPGTGGSVAKRFAKKYPVLLLSRSAKTYQPLVEEIQKAGGQALGVETDLTSAERIQNALQEAQRWQGGEGSTEPQAIAAAVFNAPGSFGRTPFLEIKEADFTKGFQTGTTTGFLFAQAVLPGLLAHAEQQRGHNDVHPATLIFTGATASVKGSARFASFAASKHALRAMAQSIAREFMPQGVHVSHAIIDAVIETERTRQLYKVSGEDATTDPEAIAEAYWSLHAQPRNAWTWEIDIRPWVEKW